MKGPSVVSLSAAMAAFERASHSATGSVAFSGPTAFAGGSVNRSRAMDSDAFAALKRTGGAPERPVVAKAFGYKCMGCGHDVRADARFCSNCGKKPSCGGCGKDLAPTANFCTNCGMKKEDAVAASVGNFRPPQPAAKVTRSVATDDVAFAQRHARLTAAKTALAQSVKMEDLDQAMLEATEILDEGAEPSMNWMQQLLLLAARRGTQAQFARVLSMCLATGSRGLRVELSMFVKMMFAMSMRGCPQVMLRLALNMAMPQQFPPVALLPPDMDKEEEGYVFEDGEPLPTVSDPTRGEVQSTVARQEDNRGDIEDAVRHLDVKRVQGMVQFKDHNSHKFFGHFCSILHIEYMKDVSCVRQRLVQKDVNQLKHTGFAITGLPVRAILATKRSFRSGALVGRAASGSNQIVFGLPQDFNMDRSQIHRGDSVMVSPAGSCNPMTDKLGDGIVNDLTHTEITISLAGQMPDDARSRRWRVDKSANHTSYERKLLALLKIVATEKELADAAFGETFVPESALGVNNLLVTTPVGFVDDWADKMKKAVNQMQREKLEESGLPTCKEPTEDSPEHWLRAGESNQALVALPMGSVARLAFDGPPLSPEQLGRVRQALAQQPGLNNSQRAAVHAGVVRRCTVIQGPPGTGKTHASASLLTLLSRQLGLRPLLATADSNIAVDNLCLGLLDRDIKAVRIGRPEKVGSRVEEVSLEAMMRRICSRQKGASGGKAGPKGDDTWDEASIVARQEAKLQQRNENRELQMELLMDAEVICTTSVGAGSDFLNKFTFEAILVDEAAQSTELSTLVPVAHRGTARLVLVGDHCQLPPSVTSMEADSRGLSVSLYARLQAQGVEPFFLEHPVPRPPTVGRLQFPGLLPRPLIVGCHKLRPPSAQGLPLAERCGASVLRRSRRR